VVGATLGVVGYVPDNIKEGNINQNVVRIRVKDKKVNPKYLSIVLSSQIGQKLILRNATITTQAYINNSQLESIIIPFPPLAIQNQIVQIMDNAYKIKKQKETEAQQLLDSIDEFVLNELGIKLPELKDRMCYVVYSDEVENKRIDAYYHHPKFKEVENAMNKGKFETKKLKQFIISLSMGISVPDYKNQNNDVPFILGKNLKHGYLNFDELEYINNETNNRNKKSILKENDILFSVRGAYIGKVAVVPKKVEGGNIINNIVKFSLTLNLNSFYLVCFLNCTISKKIIYRNVWGGAQPGFTNQQIRNLIIPIPPLETQNKIAEEVQSRIQKAERLKKEAVQVLEEAKAKVEKIILNN